MGTCELIISERKLKPPRNKLLASVSFITFIFDKDTQTHTVKDKETHLLEMPPKDASRGRPPPKKGNQNHQHHKTNPRIRLRR